MELQCLASEVRRNSCRRPQKLSLLCVSGARVGSSENQLPVNDQSRVLLVLLSLTYNSFSWYQILFYVKLLAVFVGFSFNQRHPQANSVLSLIFLN